jgi:hypothetical protein
MVTGIWNGTGTEIAPRAWMVWWTVRRHGEVGRGLDWIKVWLGRECVSKDKNTNLFNLNNY